MVVSFVFKRKGKLKTPGVAVELKSSGLARRSRGNSCHASHTRLSRSFVILVGASDDFSFFSDKSTSSLNRDDISKFMLCLVTCKDWTNLDLGQVNNDVRLTG